MSDGDDPDKGYIVGYRNPPIHSRFQKGHCPNPKGRGKAKFVDIGQTLDALMEERITIKIGGKKKVVTRQETQVWSCVREAMAGSLSAAEMVVDFLTIKEKKRGVRVPETRREEDVMRDIAAGRLPKNTIIRRDLLQRYTQDKKP